MGGPWGGREVGVGPAPSGRPSAAGKPILAQTTSLIEQPPWDTPQQDLRWGKREASACASILFHPPLIHSFTYAFTSKEGALK